MQEKNTGSVEKEPRTGESSISEQMPTLLIIIPGLWLTAVALVVLLCRGAARADLAMLTELEARRRQAGQRPPIEGLQETCELRERRLAATPLRGRDGRARGERCAAGS